MDERDKAAIRQRMEARRERNLIAAAEEMEMDMTRRSDPGFLDEVRRRWVEANREAFANWNAYVEEHGLPLEKYRPF